jgi:flagellar biosynthesis protein FlgN
MMLPTSNQPISFEQDSQLVTRLLEDLQFEQTALVKADVGRIESLLDKRLQLLQSLSMAAKNRYDALALNGFDANEIGMAAWLKQQAKPALNLAWQKFQKSLAQAKEMNRLNGILINKHFNRNQQLLTHLQGGSSSASVYGKNGQAQVQSTMRGGRLLV